jgi:lipoate-protein ligase A
MPDRDRAAYPRAEWRLLLDGKRDGASNMAIDEAILEAVIQGHSPPTLRFYGWSPPCLSLGRNQSLAEANLTACRAAGVDLVRRPSGGQAVLHAGELTYSLALLQSDPRSAGGLLEAYRRLSEGLLAGLRRLGIEAVQALGARQTDGPPSPICFDRPSDYEITFGGRKLIGSAQWRRRGGVLQHGSLPLAGDLTRIVDLVELGDRDREEERRRLAARVISLCEAGGQEIPFSAAAHGLARGLAATLNLVLTPGDLSPEEQARAAMLRAQYTSDEWTARSEFQ